MIRTSCSSFSYSWGPVRKKGLHFYLNILKWIWDQYLACYDYSKMFQASLKFVHLIFCLILSEMWAGIRNILLTELSLFCSDPPTRRVMWIPSRTFTSGQEVTSLPLQHLQIWKVTVSWLDVWITWSTPLSIYSPPPPVPGQFPVNPCPLTGTGACRCEVMDVKRQTVTHSPTLKKGRGTHQLLEGANVQSETTRSHWFCSITCRGL